MRFALLAACGTLLLFSSVAVAQKDRVRFRDRTAELKEVELEGDLVELSGGVELTGTDKKKRFLLATDVVRIDYTTLDAVKLDIAKFENAESAKDPSKAVAFYSEKLKTVAPGADRNKRFFAFRDAYWSGRVAAGKTDAGEFAAEAPKAAEKMAAFVKANTKTWEQWNIGRTAARLYGELGDWKSAEAVLRLLIAVPDAPPELKAEIKAILIGNLLRGGSVSEAQSELASLEADKGAGAAMQERLAIYKLAFPLLATKTTDRAKLTESIKKIEDAIAKAKDPTVRAVGYGTIGELYWANQMPRDAMWAYLWVDTVYNQDKEEHVFAVSRLLQYFTQYNEKDGEKSRSDQFRERLTKIR